MGTTAILGVATAVGSLSVIAVGLRQKRPPVIVIQLCVALFFLSASILAGLLVPAGSLRAITQVAFNAAATVFLVQSMLGVYRSVRPKK